MDMENVIPERAPRGSAAAKLALPVTKTLGAKAGGGKLGGGKLGGAPTRRRALGDITNNKTGTLVGVSGGAGGGNSTGGVKKRAAVSRAPLADVIARPVPLGPDGEIADVESIPKAGLEYKAAYQPPDLVQELGLDLEQLRSGSTEEYDPLDELLTRLESEPMPFDIEDEVDDLDVGRGSWNAESDAWYPSDDDGVSDLSLFDLPALTL